MIERYTRPEMGRIWSQENKLDKWLEVEIAVCQAWADQGVIPREAMDKIRHARYDIERMAEYEREMHHDLLAFLRSVADTLGEESRYIHLGLTSYDVEDTALALLLKQSAELLERGVAELIDVLQERALEQKDTLMMGRTHGIHAEPITFGLKLALWLDEMRRHARRLAEAKAEISVGKISGAVGSHATVPPALEEAVCSGLGLGVAPVSTQIVQRDRHARFITTLAIIAASLEKFATEIRHLQRTEVAEVAEPFAAGQTGSSAMPHKRNPEKCERISGLARLFRGYTTAALENVALWHERDLTDSAPERIVLPDACILLDYVLDLFTFIMRGLDIFPERMRENLESTYGVIFSQRVLLALVEKGLKRQDAYKLAQRNAMRAWKERSPYLDALYEDAEVLEHISREELAALFDYRYFVRFVDESFRRLGLLS
ncbi:MAG: adenylosuccinate lyase [Dehalococcoidia bacterium]|nr:MAG: adenylosuccinate lyase [Dehalococcoidia bacterium]